MTGTKDVGILRKDNFLVKTNYSLTPTENKVFNLIMFNTQRQNYYYNPEEDMVCKCVVALKEFKEIIASNKHNRVSGIKEILDKLWSTKVELEVNRANKTKVDNTCGLISEHSYDTATQEFTIIIPSQMAKILCREFGTGKYTPVDMTPFFKLETYSGQRLYDLIRQWSGNTKSITVDFKEFKAMLGLENRYKDNTNFFVKVVEPAIEDLNNLTGLDGKKLFKVSYEANRKSNRVVSITFKYKDLGKRQEDEIVNDAVVLDDTDSNVTEFPVKGQKKSPVVGSTEENTIVSAHSKNHIINLISESSIASYEKDFKSFSFDNKENYMMLRESILTTLKATQKLEINGSNYNYFKKVLNNKLYAKNRANY